MTGLRAMQSCLARCNAQCAGFMYWEERARSFDEGDDTATQTDGLGYVTLWTSRRREGMSFVTISITATISIIITIVLALAVLPSVSLHVLCQSNTYLPMFTGHC